MEFSVPESIETDRLVLRQFEESDWNPLFAYYSNPRAVRYTIGNPLTEGETWEKILGKYRESGIQILSGDVF